MEATLAEPARVDPPPPTPVGAALSDPDRGEPGRPGLGWIAAFVVLSIGLISIGLSAAIDFAGSPIDGPFQLFNALRRIVAGQRLGGTFQFFHGPGVPYLHIVPYVLFGGGFLASEVSRQLVSITVALGSTMWVMRAWTGSWRSTFPMTVAAVLLMVFLRFTAVLYPINSMLGLRSTIPLLFGIHVLTRGWTRRATIERAVLAGLALLCGTEQGMSLVAAFLIVSAIVGRQRREWGPLIQAALVAAGGVVTLVVGVFILAGPSGFGSVLAYNFRVIPGDQFWYFGAPPNPMLDTWAKALELVVNLPEWLILIFGSAAYTLVRLWRGARRPDADRRIAEAYLAVCALLSMASILGTFVAVYLQPATRIGAFIALIALRRWWRTRPRIVEALRRAGMRFVPELATTALLVVFALSHPTMAAEVVRAPTQLVRNFLVHGRRWTVSSDWQTAQQVGIAALDRAAVRLKRQPVLWSTYAGLLEWNTATFHPSFDYIIHALGHDNRLAYERTFATLKPDVVQTLRPDYSLYEEWLESNHWRFYRELLRQYEFDAGGPWSMFWMRRDAPFDEAPRVIADAAVPPGQMAISVDIGAPADSIALYEVRLRYHVRNPIGWIPIVGGTPRYLVGIGQVANHIPVSLAPYETERTFPILTAGRAPLQLVGSVVSPFGPGAFAIDSIRVTRLRISPDNMEWARLFVRRPEFIR